MSVARFTLVVLALTLTSASVEAGGYVWRFHNTHPEKRPSSVERINFASRVNELTEGRLVVNIFNNGALGVSKPDLLRALKFGAVEMSVLIPSYLGRDSRVLASVLPFGVVYSWEEELAILPELIDIYKEQYTEWGIEVVGWQVAPPFRTSIFCNEAIKSIEDLQGKKVRVWDKALVNTFRRLGAAGQLISSNELYIAMQTGVVDCALYGIGVAHVVSLQEISTHVTDIAILSGLTAIGVNKAVWETLPPDIQKKVKQAGDELLQESIRNAETKIKAIEDERIQALKDAGELEIHGYMSENDRAAFEKAVHENWDEAVVKAGPVAVKYKARIVNAIRESRKRYETVLDN